MLLQFHFAVSFLSLHRTVIRLVREKQWDQTPTRASCHMDPSQLKFQTDLNPVTFFFFFILLPFTAPLPLYTRSYFCVKSSHCLCSLCRPNWKQLSCCIQCGYIFYLLYICFRHTVDGGSDCSRDLVCGLLPHHPHHCGQSRQQEACTNRALTITLLLLGASIKSKKASISFFTPVLIYNNQNNIWQHCAQEEVFKIKQRSRFLFVDKIKCCFSHCNKTTINRNNN